MEISAEVSFHYLDAIPLYAYSDWCISIRKNSVYFLGIFLIIKVYKAKLYIMPESPEKKEICEATALW